LATLTGYCGCLTLIASSPSNPESIVSDEVGLALEEIPAVRCQRGQAQPSSGVNCHVLHDSDGLLERYIRAVDQS
jgi:hypothetical protein